MGAGKTTVGLEVARRLSWDFADTDAEIERRIACSIEEFFDREGESAFREVETDVACEAITASYAGVVALGGGAVESDDVLEAIDDVSALVVLLDVDAEIAWERVAGSRRPLARDRAKFMELYERRVPIYRDEADEVARDADDVILAIARVSVAAGALEALAEHIGGDSDFVLVTEPHVNGIHGVQAQTALGSRLRQTFELPRGEDAKTVAAVERVWSLLDVDRYCTLVALGGGCVTDAAGFVAATYMRGIEWVAVPTTLVGQVDAAIGGKTAINLSAGKNLVGAFHWPARTVIDPTLLATLPDRERREGLSEVVKTGLLAGAPLWELPDTELVRRCAAFKAGVCIRDPHDFLGDRAQLNFGHTFAHALEAAADYHGVSHGEAVALGLLAAARLSVDQWGLDPNAVQIIEEVLQPRAVAVDRARAWKALLRDKKREAGEIVVVLLNAAGAEKVSLPPELVRRELDLLIAE